MNRLRALAVSAILFGFACATTPNYPSVWFTPVADPNPPKWEVLPQAAGKNEVILSKRNELGILSNFAATPFVLRGRRYASVEGFWQMMHFPEGAVDGRPDPRAKLKPTEWIHTRDEVAAMTAFDAKKAGDVGEKNAAKLGIDWVSFDGRKFPYRTKISGEHYRLIREAMTEKLKQNPEVRRILIATGDLNLRPDHHGEADSPPEWRYYELWMELRILVRTGTYWLTPRRYSGSKGTHFKIQPKTSIIKRIRVYSGESYENSDAEIQSADSSWPGDHGHRG